ncbi:bola domain-containing protein [Linderina pennispora]|uniref:Bola domain-containing protein n=1 Tax=Linderina pennispora TaxID=61395 RepID=A0A1Y1W7T1_9FUNG|nr:bola domain-containing protein [Linderina pennispora]ORX69600.1 bola domain-containing protein [Linderina pennispora]
MTSADDIKNKLMAELPATHVEVLDVSGGCGSMFQAIVVSEAFDGKSRLQRQRLVNEKNYSPSQYEAAQAQTA